MQEWTTAKPSIIKASPEGSNKSDDDFITASECTGTPQSASSFHTASEGERVSPWWEVDPSNSSENEQDGNQKGKTGSLKIPEVSNYRFFIRDPVNRKVEGVI